MVTHSFLHPRLRSGGTTMCQILNTLEGYDLKGMGFNSAASIHVMSEAMRHAFMDRNTFLAIRLSSRIRSTAC